MREREEKYFYGIINIKLKSIKYIAVIELHKKKDSNSHFEQRLNPIEMCLPQPKNLTKIKLFKKLL